MKVFLAICMIGLCSTAVYINTPEVPRTPDSGICVIEFNASFNASNSVGWIEGLSDCNGKRVDIAANPELQKEHKIVVVPTVIIFNEGEEVKRFQANIMMQLEATEKDVQEVVDEILMDAF